MDDKSFPSEPLPGDPETDAPPPAEPDPHAASYDTAPEPQVAPIFEQPNPQAAPPRGRPSATGPTFEAPPRTPYAPAPPPPPPPRHGFSWGAFLGGTVFGCGCLSWLIPLLVITILASTISTGESGPRRNTVGLINVDGIITSGEPNGGLFGSTGAEAQRIVKQLEMARKSPRIRAVVLYINSPGGSAAGSDAIYNEILKLKASGKPVVSAMGDVAASGGYYVAAATDRIYANGATLTGSIGVITEISNFSDPDGWISKSGYDVEVIKSGRYKDMGNPFRPMPAEERALFQQMVDDIYNQFLSAVSKGRKMPVATLRPLADGRVYTGRQALRLKLVDQIGTLQDAIEFANKKAGLKPDADAYLFKENPFSELMGGPALLAPGLTGAGRNPLGLLLMDPRAQALARNLAGQPAGLNAK